MKKLLRILVERLLLIRAKRVLNVVDHIIGITGSIGKTSTRIAIANVLSSKYSVLTSSQNFNTPMGLLLSVLGREKTGNSFLAWVKILIEVYYKTLPKPQILVLEYGIDAPNDMNTLLKIAVPDIVVLTPISLAHTDVGQFENLNEIREEKLKLACAAKRKVIANGFDHETVTILREKIPQSVRIFGMDPDADIPVNEARAEDLGVSFRVREEYYFAPVFGKFQAQIFAPAIILGKEFGVDNEEIKRIIGAYKPPAGRGRILGGVNGSVLWDFSYNSSPTAVMAALFALKDIPGFSRKIALLGNMNELGERASEEHRKLGKIAEETADYIFFTGKNSQDFLRGIEKKEKVRILPNSEIAGKYLADFLKQGDILLIKGSQNGVFLEAAVEQLLEKKEEKNLLCRQSERWNLVRKKFFSKNISAL